MTDACSLVLLSTSNIYVLLFWPTGLENCTEPCLIYTVSNRIDAIELASSSGEPGVQSYVTTRSWCPCKWKNIILERFQPTCHQTYEHVQWCHERHYYRRPWICRWPCRGMGKSPFILDRFVLPQDWSCLLRRHQKKGALQRVLELSRWNSGAPKERVSRKCKMVASIWGELVCVSRNENLAKYLFAVTWFFIEGLENGMN